MKIKMNTCVVAKNTLLTYNAGREFTVGENISKEQAENFVNAKFAIVIEEDKVEETESPKVTEKPAKTKRGKKNEI